MINSERRLHRVFAYCAVLVIWSLLFGWATSAQTLDATFTTGRFYNIATGEWTIASVPGLELCVAEKVTLSGSWWFDTKRGGYFEQDLSLAWQLLEAKEQPTRWLDRVSVSLTGAVYIFRELGTDRVWMVETRYRVFGRN